MSNARPQTRRRGDNLVRAVYTATADALCTVGYGNLTIESIAAAAGTGKAALYRRWPSLDDLVRDTLGDLLPPPPVLDASTPLRDGLVEVVAYLNEALFASKRAAFVAVASHSAEETSKLRELLRERVLDPCQHQLMTLGGERGELVASTAPAMVMYECTMGRPPLTRTRVEAIVDTVLLPLMRV